MDKRYVVIAAVLFILVLIGGGYFLLKTQTPKPAADAVSTIPPVAAVVQDESGPTANPYEKTNPFSNIKVNPFE